MSAPAHRSTDMPSPDFGPPEAEFHATVGQTAAGLVMTGSLVAAGLAGALLDGATEPSGRFCMAAIGVAGTLLTSWMFALRRWRLWVCPGGLIQRRAWAEDHIAWPNVREVIVECSPNPPTPRKVTLVRAERGGDVVLWPITCGKAPQALAAVLKAAHDREIAVRTLIVERGTG